MTTQPSLFSTRKSPRVSDRDVAWMLWMLDGEGWVTAQRFPVIAMARDWRREDFDPTQINRRSQDRTLRAIAAASQGRIISGQKGYCLTKDASVEDVNHAAAWLEHQAGEMQRRAREIRKAMHRRTHAA